MSKHPEDDVTTHLLQCHMEYEKGDKAVVAVPWSKNGEQLATMYSYKIKSGEIENYGNVSLPT